MSDITSGWLGACGKSSDGGMLSSPAFSQPLRHDAPWPPIRCTSSGSWRSNAACFFVRDVGEHDEAISLGRTHHMSKESSITTCPQPGAMVGFAFGILAPHRWLNRKALGVLPEVVMKVTCILHNFTRQHSVDKEDPGSTALCTKPSAGLQTITHSAATTPPEKHWLWKSRLPPAFPPLLVEWVY